MRSPAPKQAESEFDDLLGQLADELALTPASQSGVSLMPDLEEPQKIQAASNAPASVLKPAPAKPDNTIVKVVGIIAASLTLVSVVALVVFGGGDASDERVAVVDDAAVAAQADRDAADATRRRAEQEARAQSIAAARAATQAEFARVEAKRLSAVALAEQAKPKAKPKPRKKPKPKPKQDLGSDFDSL